MTDSYQNNDSGYGIKIECPNCGDVLVFDPDSGKMRCDSCRSLFSSEELGNADKYAEENSEEITCNNYVCRSCGARLQVSDNECSTFCAYCGQPTVVFDRVSSMRKPDVIIPFSVSRERAVELLRKEVKRAKFIPRELKNFTIERVSGIYVPFRLYDVSYSDNQLISAKSGSGKNVRTHYYTIEADTEFKCISLDASNQLEDMSSRRLEPFNTDALMPFKIEYLSGFYADASDTDESAMEYAASKRAAQLFDKQTKDTICNDDHVHDATIVKKEPSYQIERVQYALFPAWFLTFRYADKAYTMLVNGQTEKVVGGLPVNNRKMNIVTFILTAVLTVPVFLMVNSMMKDLEDTGKILGFITTVAIVLVITAAENVKKVKKSNALSAADEINSFSKNRQRPDGKDEQ
jgi:predicted RNA-binding Zn-ribbon protein involved in translation (DUF1610 family)